MAAFEGVGSSRGPPDAFLRQLMLPRLKLTVPNKENMEEEATADVEIMHKHMAAR